MSSNSKSKHRHSKHGKHGKHSRSLVKEIFSLMSDNAPTYYVEAYKMLATNIEFIAVAQDCKNIMVTSALPDEGKTNCAVNLALSLAGYGKTVCLVDCDLRKPSLHRLKRHPVGLTHVLKGEISLEEAIFPYEEESKLCLLLGGMIPPNPTELLASKKMQRVVDSLAEKFDFVIYDTPPCLGISDVSVLGRYLDAAIIVCKHESTDKRLAAKAKSNLDNAGVNVIGAILSEYKAESNMERSYYYSYGGYYGKEDD